MRILVAEDDLGLRSVLERGLKEAGYAVDGVGDGEAALSFLRTYEYAAAVIDWRMPKVSGLEVVERVRHNGHGLPILMLTALDTTRDVVTGLNAGADDYLVKPFEFPELVARVRALLRRPPDASPPVLRCGGVDLDPATREASVSGHPVALTPIEFSILELLMRRSPQVVRRATIALAVWDDEAAALGSNTIDVHVGRLRSKLGDAEATIETVRGLGYRITAR